MFLNKILKKYLVDNNIKIKEIPIENKNLFNKSYFNLNKFLIYRI